MKKFFQRFNHNWYGLSTWSCYFFLKIALFYSNKINFHALENFVFALVLMIPIQHKIYRRIFRIFAVCVAVSLFWHDSKLPGLRSVMDNFSLLLSFNLDYILNLMNRVVDWKYLALGIVIFFIIKFLLINRKLSLFTTAVTILGIVSVGIFQSIGLKNHFNGLRDDFSDSEMLYDRSNLQVSTENKGDIESIVTKFYSDESHRQVNFSKALTPQAQPFEILVLNICSLSWDDLKTVGLSNASLFAQSDILFTHFNSATSYSGPAALRLIHASCGQLTHRGLYSNLQCNLFNDLAQLGFQKELVLDHNGKFDEYLETIEKYGDFKTPMMSQQGIPVALQAFDNSPLYDDTALLNKWLQRQHAPRTVTFTNIMSLHDGNHYPGKTATADYKERTQKLFSGIETLIGNLEKEHRKVMIVIVPEHGANVHGDDLQISGLRDIPNYTNTNVPVAIRFTGLAGQHPAKTMVVDEPTSYLAVAEMMNKMAEGTIFTTPQINWAELVTNLPHTMAVSENENVRAILLNQKQYFSENKARWIEYK